ncbi:MAG: AtpZ/AtpI family protein [Lentisphaerae bacterium]|nr:AtpZ/AtpI family protein [Lentisphaerota bacterium]
MTTPQQPWRQYAALSALGLTLVLCTFLGLGLGLFLDRRLDTQPALTIAGLLIGIAAGFMQIFEKIRTLGK